MAVPYNFLIYRNAARADAVVEAIRDKPGFYVSIIVQRIMVFFIYSEHSYQIFIMLKFHHVVW